ncbi:hypothetical protein GCM10023114_12640 [Mycolicibacterium sediminis]|uniref:Uncharacterized protein n=1 Tax=Mycolicibacterium sediminis TaxID=1286180 RepID=A0A7I7QPW4_9MYCO|nr:hypothetical protein MSEDJ_24570 [Mycolicibacterium sediminis]
MPPAAISITTGSTRAMGLVEASRGTVGGGSTVTYKGSDGDLITCLDALETLLVPPSLVRFTGADVG